MAEESIADITPVPQRYRGQILTTSGKLAENGLFLFQFLLYTAIAFAPAVVGGIAATSWNLFPNNPNLNFSPVVVGLGLTFAVGWVLGGQMMRKPWSADFMFHRAQRAIAERPDTIVDANNEDAIYVEIIPRRNWSQVSLQNAEDVGFLHLDDQRGELLFEGDNKRYRIGVQQVISHSVELMNPSAANDPRATPIGLLVIKVRDRLGEREIPIRPVRTVAGDSLGGNYMERAHELQRRIANVLPQESGRFARV